jgi:Dullard-like phosphatase family protein
MLVVIALSSWLAAAMPMENLGLVHLENNFPSRTSSKPYSLFGSSEETTDAKADGHDAGQFPSYSLIGETPDQKANAEEHFARPNSGQSFAALHGIGDSKEGVTQFGQPLVGNTEQKRAQAAHRQHFTEEDLIRSLPRPAHRSDALLAPLLKPSKPTLVLDMDETLIHCSLKEVSFSDFTIKSLSGTHTHYCIKRPYLEYFLQEVGKMYEVILWSAGSDEYVHHVVKNHLGKKYFDYVLGRSSCRAIDKNYFIKELTRLNRDKRKTVAVDNSISAFPYDFNNLIPITSYVEDNMNDMQLLNTLEQLMDLATADDVTRDLKGLFDLENAIFGRSY